MLVGLLTAYVLGLKSSSTIGPPSDSGDMKICKGLVKADAYACADSAEDWAALDVAAGIAGAACLDY